MGQALVFSRRIFIVFALIAAFFTACTTIKYIPVKEYEYIHVRDSVYFRDTLIRIELEKARLSDFVDLGDTLVLQTDLARSTAFLDTASGTLKGTLENIKKEAVQNVPLKERIVYRDSISYVEKLVPVEVEKKVKVVPLFYRIFSVIGLALVFGLAIYLGFKFL